LGRAPEFLDLHYLIGADTDHVAKFRGDRPRELGYPRADQKSNKKHHDHEQIIRLSGTTVPGSLIINQNENPTVIYFINFTQARFISFKNFTVGYGSCSNITA